VRRRVARDIPNQGRNLRSSVLLDSSLQFSLLIPI
jgi:hypothetical protein